MTWKYKYSSQDSTKMKKRKKKSEIFRYFEVKGIFKICYLAHRVAVSRRSRHIPFNIGNTLWLGTEKQPAQYVPTQTFNFSLLFWKIVFFSKKVVKWKIFKTSMATKKVILIFVPRRPPCWKYLWFFIFSTFHSLHL